MQAVSVVKEILSCGFRNSNFMSLYHMPGWDNYLSNCAWRASHGDYLDPINLTPNISKILEQDFKLISNRLRCTYMPCEWEWKVCIRHVFNCLKPLSRVAKKVIVQSCKTHFHSVFCLRHTIKRRSFPRSFGFGK